MNDFVKISKTIVRDDPDFSACIGSSQGFDDSFYSYQLTKGHDPLKVVYNRSKEVLTVSGNFGMFMHGHNIQFSYSDFNDSLCYASEQLNVDLFKFNVNQFDHSAVIQVNEKPEYYINNHLSIAGHSETVRKFGKYWDSLKQVVKMYDATKRMKQVYSKPIREKIYQELGISDQSNMLRFEKKYKNPNKTFNSSLTIDDILKPEFIATCNRDLISTYQSIMKTGIIQIPEKKKDLNSSTLPLILLQELAAIYGFDTRELLRQRMKAIPIEILNKDDKKHRQRQIDSNLKKIKSAEKSLYDLSDQLAESLKY
jgi:hypothetical protein